MKDLIADGGWVFIWVGFIATLLYALDDHSETCEEIRQAKGRKKIWKRCKLGLLWSLPTIALIAAIGSQWASDKGEKKLLTLEQKLQPRVITAQQSNDFILLTEKLPKFPIRTIVGTARDEPIDYAAQIRNMLSSAGYSPPDSDLSFSRGVFLSRILSIHAEITNANKWVYVVLVTDTTNYPSLYYFDNEDEKQRPFMHENDTNSAYAALLAIFNRIGIPADWVHEPSLVYPAHCAVYITDRPY